MALKPGELVGKDFRILRPLATGGMGAVYVAEQLSTGRKRALKIMAPALVADEKSRQRFVDEARIGGRIDSEHVVEVIAAGIDDARPWLAMELLDGENLEERVERRGPLALDVVIDLYEQLAHALDRAHAQGIVHRDLKPANLFLARPRQKGGHSILKVLDFGIASVAGNAAGATATSAIGSPLWLAPEQLSIGAKLRATTDVWSLGLIGFYLLTGKSYWRAANAVPFDLPPLIAEIVTGALAEASERAAELGAPPLPSGFDVWFARCVHRDPSARFPSAHEVAAGIAALRAPLADLPVTRPEAAAGTAPLPDSIERVAPTMPLEREQLSATAPLPPPRRWARYAIVAFVMALAGVTAAIVASGVLEPTRAAPRLRTRREATDLSAPPPVTSTVTFTSAFAGELVVDGDVVGTIDPGAPRTIEVALGAHTVEVRGLPPHLAGVVFAERQFEADEDVVIELASPCPDETAWVPGETRGFCIDRHEVTVSALAAAVRAGRCDPPGRALEDGCNWIEASARADHPMNCVSFDEAAAYCRAMGGRLPSSEEWTRAARGTGRAVYPWGDEAPDGSRLQWSAAGTSPVGSHAAGASPFGLHDMAGNVFEWTSDGAERRVIRGGSWADSDPARVLIDTETRVPASTHSAGLGFRCVRDAHIPVGER